MTVSFSSDSNVIKKYFKLIEIKNILKNQERVIVKAYFS